ncbi:hypothetical protein [Aureibacter tunicatorum]|uniref:DoxX-like protein n=1 Tax=Aureibacter tunicatorum TaxID=866807 RepID=A0AAE3XPW7_9BACT|nr:hypothetical protein [Aureibacter tunicatorum]MDR6240397.1 hypothetical protein [Aureibacter tunicatorum]BDD05723.1 hypothetical protein AUTU_32060 [Aureibacter tunicatorum]
MGIAIFEIIIGTLLISNIAVPLATLAIFPVAIFAFFYHLSIDIHGISGAAFALVFNIILFIQHFDSYKMLLVSK